jgi:hypothetical protein
MLQQDAAAQQAAQPVVTAGPDPTSGAGTTTGIPDPPVFDMAGDFGGDVSG